MEVESAWRGGDDRNCFGAGAHLRLNRKPSDCDNFFESHQTAVMRGNIDFFLAKFSNCIYN